MYSKEELPKLGQTGVQDLGKHADFVKMPLRIISEMSRDDVAILQSALRVNSVWRAIKPGELDWAKKWLLEQAIDGRLMTPEKIAELAKPDIETLCYQKINYLGPEELRTLAKHDGLGSLARKCTKEWYAEQMGIGKDEDFDRSDIFTKEWYAELDSNAREWYFLEKWEPRDTMWALSRDAVIKLGCSEARNKLSYEFAEKIVEQLDYYYDYYDAINAEYAGRMNREDGENLPEQLFLKLSYWVLGAMKTDTLKGLAHEKRRSCC